MIKKLLDYGANPEKIDSVELIPPLFNAIRNNKTNIVRFLLGILPNVDTMVCAEYTPLHYAVTHLSSEKIIDLLLGVKGISIDIKDSDGQTPLYNAIAIPNFDMVKTLINRGANINVQDNDGNTPLHWAAMITGNDEEIIRIIELLLSELLQIKS